MVVNGLWRNNLNYWQKLWNEKEGVINMGWKDDKWREAPGYCVECDNLRPLNKAAVCKECYEDHPSSWYERWEEDEYNSQWYYLDFVKLLLKIR